MVFKQRKENENKTTILHMQTYPSSLYWQSKIWIIYFNIHLLKIRLKSIMGRKRAYQIFVFTLYSKFFCVSFQLQLSHLNSSIISISYNHSYWLISFNLAFWAPTPCNWQWTIVKHQENYQLQGLCPTRTVEFFMSPYFRQLHKHC